MKIKFNLRTISQISVLLIILTLAFLHQKFGIESAAPVDAYCPFGAIETLFKSIINGGFINRIYYSNFILLGLFIIMTFLFGRVFCGFFCPLGAIQEWLRKLGKKLGIKKDYELPKAADKVLRYLKYLIMIAIIYLSFAYGDLIFRGYDPFVALTHLGNEFEEIMYAYIILGIVVVGSLFTKSFWCRYACPVGAFFGILKKFSLFKLEKNEKTCTKCKQCDRGCPVALDFNDMKQVNSAECISCLKCVDVCSVNALKIKFANKDIKPKTFRAVTVYSFLAVMLVIIFTPFWQTKPVTNFIGPDGKINVEDLRGSNTLEYVIEKTKIPFSYFQEKLGLPADMDKKSKLKHIGEDYNVKNKEGQFIEMEEFKEAIKGYESGK